MRFLGPFKAADKTKLLEFSYMVTIALLLSAVVFTPIFITRHFLLFKKYVIQEDAVETVLILILLMIAYLLSNVYKKELTKYLLQAHRLSRDKNNLSSTLNEAFKYIGGVNVQIQEIRSVFCGIGRYPTTENEFKTDLTLFARKGLEIVNADWVVIRIIRQTDLRTMNEHLEFRKNVNFSIKGISNKAIVANQAIAGYSIVASCQVNSMIKVVCVFPQKSLDKTERILVEAITNQIEMRYLIFTAHQLDEIYLNRKPITRNSREIDRFASL